MQACGDIRQRQRHRQRHAETQAQQCGDVQRAGQKKVPDSESVKQSRVRQRSVAQPLERTCPGIWQRQREPVTAQHATAATTRSRRSVPPVAIRGSAGYMHLRLPVLSTVLVSVLLLVLVHVARLMLSRRSTRIEGVERARHLEQLLLYSFSNLKLKFKRLKKKYMNIFYTTNPSCRQLNKS